MHGNSAPNLRELVPFGMVMYGTGGVGRKGQRLTPSGGGLVCDHELHELHERLTECRAKNTRQQVSSTEILLLVQYNLYSRDRVALRATCMCRSVEAKEPQLVSAFAGKRRCDRHFSGLRRVTEGAGFRFFPGSMFSGCEF